MLVGVSPSARVPTSNRPPPKRDGPALGATEPQGGGAAGLIAAGAAPKKYESLTFEAVIKSNTRSHENGSTYFFNGADRRSWRGLFGPYADEWNLCSARRPDLPCGCRLSALDRQAAPEGSTQQRLFSVPCLIVIPTRLELRALLATPVGSEAKARQLLQGTDYCTQHISVWRLVERPEKSRRIRRRIHSLGNGRENSSSG
jgi:hypothetical protein